MTSKSNGQAPQLRISKFFQLMWLNYFSFFLFWCKEKKVLQTVKVSTSGCRIPLLISSCKKCDKDAPECMSVGNPRIQDTRLLDNWRQEAPQGLLSSWNTPSSGNSLKLEHNRSTHAKIALGEGIISHIMHWEKYNDYDFGYHIISYKKIYIKIKK